MGGSWPGSCEAMELAQAGLSLSVPGSCVLMEVTCSTLEPEARGTKAIGGGATVIPQHLEQQKAGPCSDPVTMALWASRPLQESRRM